MLAVPPWAQVVSSPTTHHLGPPLFENGEIIVAYSPDAIFFDGSSDYMRRVGRLTSVVDGRQGAISVWIRRDEVSGAQREIFTSINTSTSANFVLRWLADDTLRILGERPGVGPDVFNYFTSVQPIGSYIHVLSSWDVTDNAKRHLYINDVDDINIAVQIEDDIAYDSLVNDYLLGTLFAGSADKWHGAVSELWFNTTEYIDFAIVANRRKFITASLEPVDPGVDGSIPTGTIPALYLRGNQTDQGVNGGFGGNVISQGTQVPGETPGPNDIPPQVIPIGIASETDFAFDTFPVVGTLVDLATEVDFSQTMESAKVKAINPALETDQSLPVFQFPLARFVDQVVETDLALDIVAFGGLEVFVVARLGQATGAVITESETTSA